ncbi:MAG: DUF1315 family protein [Gammaproteobacteria bacterium]|nr:DUF1315 family protein [Pseudomonadales bacterium]MCP5346006.1 DUF1315 family protein [Pseudomonadales bacterium]
MLDRKPDSLAALLEGITPEIYTRLKNAVEIGKWDNGQVLSRQQVEYCLQALIAYEHRNVPVDQRTGFIDPGTLSGSACSSNPATIASDRNPAPKGETNDS